MYVCVHACVHLDIYTYICTELCFWGDKLQLKTFRAANTFQNITLTATVVKTPVKILLENELKKEEAGLKESNI